ncbi:MAG: hypothetical protein QG652_1573, partial [Pseudomonadota bacterium]|nr:hypothetical protein [Pseudomonadota bacterium]
MNLKGVIPVIEVDNIERQLEFYQQAFRFIPVNKRIGSHGLEWVHLKSDNTYLMLLQRSHPVTAPSPNKNITLY